MATRYQHRPTSVSDGRSPLTADHAKGEYRDGCGDPRGCRDSGRGRCGAAREDRQSHRSARSVNCLGHSAPFTFHHLTTALVRCSTGRRLPPAGPSTVRGISMVRSEHRSARTLVRRGLVAATMVLALAVYGLATAGTQSFAFKPTAASGASTSAGLAVSQAVSPTNNSLNVATQGPNHSLYFFWNVAGKWYGPLGIGAAGSTFSAPTIVADPSSGNFDIAVEGPSHTLDFYWDIKGTWYGPFEVAGAGTTYSTPGLVEDGSGHLQIAAQGPGNTLDVYWNVSAKFYGPLGIGGPGSTFTGPSLTLNGPTTVYAWVQGRNHDLEVYTLASGVWSSASDASNDNTAYSAAGGVLLLPMGNPGSIFEGPNNSLYQAFGPSSPALVKQLRGGGTTYSMPSAISPTGPGVAGYIANAGPSNTLSFYFPDSTTGNLDGPLQIGGTGSTFSAPSLIQDGNGNQDIAVEGPSNTLWAYFDIGGVKIGRASCR